MNNIIYRVAYNSRGDTMGPRSATDAQGVATIVEEHYRTVFGPCSVDIDVDMEALTVTVRKAGYRKSYRILRYRLDTEE